MFRFLCIKGAILWLATASTVAAATAAPHPLLSAAEGEDRQVLQAVLAYAPELSAARARASALRHDVESAGRLPDPSASLTAFALPPETRLGAQRLSLSARQALPRPKTRRLDRQVAQLRAEQAETEIAALTLRLLTRARILLAESDSLRRQIEILRDQELNLEAHEENARARYAGGRGLAADAVRLQAALTGLGSEKLTLESRLASHRVELARMTGFQDVLDKERDAAERDTAKRDTAPNLRGDACTTSAWDSLVDAAQKGRPELRRAVLESRIASLGVERVEESLKPSFSVGLAYTLVESRDDAMARLNPPAGNGDDIVALTGGVTVPLWRAKNEARLTAAGADEVTAGAAERAVRAEIRRQVEEPLARLRPLCRQVNLLTDVLMLQAEEALRSAVAGYGAGTLDALALLDAEHRLFEVRSAAVRATTDLEIARIQLEGALGRPLPPALPISDATDDSDSSRDLP